MKNQRLYRSAVDTPYGEMVVMATDNGLCLLDFNKPNRKHVMENRLNRWFAGYNTYKVEDTATPVLAAARQWLRDYFRGSFDTLTQPLLDLRGTPFELSVWQALLQIPLGKTVSYQTLAKRLNKPTASRAVGGANGRNPVSLIVPCHRVIGENGTLTGYGGGIDIKKALLLHENTFSDQNPFH